jgi:hypothetical protein
MRLPKILLDKSPEKTTTRDGESDQFGVEGHCLHSTFYVADLLSPAAALCGEWAFLSDGSAEISGYNPELNVDERHGLAGIWTRRTCLCAIAVEPGQMSG